MPFALFLLPAIDSDKSTISANSVGFQVHKADVQFKWKWHDNNGTNYVLHTDRIWKAGQCHCQRRTMATAMAYSWQAILKLCWY